MKVTKVTCFPISAASGKAKANGTVTLEDAIELKYVLMQGPKDLFVSWAGGKSYTKKDGAKGWDSPIYVKDEATNKTITEQIMSKYKSVGTGLKGSSQKQDSSSSSSYDQSSDDIPF
jgi:hypothetical protein